MSSVLVLIIIPDKLYEEEVRQKEKLSSRLFKKKDHLKTINETINENEENERRYPMEKIVEDGLSYLGVVDASWSKSKNDRYFTITFPVDIEDSDCVIQYFKSLGIGLRLDTSIGIIPFSLFCYNEELSEMDDQEIILENGDKNVNRSIGNFKEKQSKFLKSVTARLTVAQVVDNVRSSGELTFDFICYILFASMIAAMGLLENSVVSLVASMLVSPMMGPVMAVTFGAVIKEYSLIRVGFKNVLASFAFTIGFGYVFGLVVLNFTEYWADQAWPTDMMRERGLLRVVWVGILVAFPSGCAGAISLLQGNEASLVGVAISVSLLPPAVNAGLHWAYSTLCGLYSIGQTAQQYKSHFSNSTIWLRPALAANSKYMPVYSDNMVVESLLLGLVSWLLSVINISNIIIGAMLLLKIKEIAPLATMSPENRRFFQEDLKIAREYNEKSRGSNLGDDVLQEWATIAGLDKNEFLKPESRAIRLQTLADIAKDVEADVVYQTVTRNMINVPTADNLARRMSHAVFSAGNLIRHDPIRSSLRSAVSVTPNRTPNRSPLPHVVISDLEVSTSARPSSTANRRRISTVALNNFFEKEDNLSSGRSPRSPGGMVNTAFSFNEADINQHNQQLAYDRNRRYSSALLRRTLQTADHSPYSLWPSTRQDNPKFTVTSVSEGTKRPSIPQLSKFD